MEKGLLEYLNRITPEEQAILDGKPGVDMALYNNGTGTMIDYDRLLEKGSLIDIRPNTRFVHFPRHTHNYVEMTYMVQGTTSHLINDSELLTLKAGDLLILNQYVTQELFQAGSDDIAVNFIIRPEFFSGTLEMLEGESTLKDFIIMSLSGVDMPGYLHFESHDLLPVQNLLENMIWTLANKKGGVDAINMTTMGLLFLNLMRFAPTARTLNPAVAEQNLVYEMIKYIEVHFEDAQLGKFAARKGESIYYLSRLLKKSTGHNFKELLKVRKLREAARLLTTSQMTVENIMSVIGYDNSSFFYRAFSAQYDMSPAEYRKKSR